MKKRSALYITAIITGLITCVSSFAGMPVIPVEASLRNQNTTNSNPITVGFTFASHLQNVTSWSGGQTASVQTQTNSTKVDQVFILSGRKRSIYGTMQVNFTASINGFSSIVASEPVTVVNNRVQPEYIPFISNAQSNFACSFETDNVGPGWKIEVDCATGAGATIN